MATVLVVDDDEDVRFLLGSVLRRTGFAVLEAVTGIDALAQLAATETMPDLIVLDVQMPDLDGWETLESLRLDIRTRTVPVMLCTVRAAEADIERAWSLGCDDVVTKPFAIAELVERATRLIESRSRG